MLEITCEQFGYPVAELISRYFRLGQEIVRRTASTWSNTSMELEAEFQITISDQMAEEWFTHQPLTLL